MRKLILHIGRHKSGTSSLQKFLCENFESLLESGYEYPLEGRDPIAHHLLAKYLNTPEKLSPKETEAVLMLLKKVNESQNNIILSSEALQNIDPEKLSNFLDADLTIYIVIYIRDQLTYCLSSYSQAIQNQCLAESLEQYSDRFFKNLDYLKFINSWINNFPHANIIVKHFERNFLKKQDVRFDFLEILRIKDTGKFNFENKDANPSIGGKLLEYKRVLNKSSLCIGYRKKLYKILSELAQEDQTFVLKKNVTKDTLIFVKDIYKLSNEKLRKTWGIDLSSSLEKISTTTEDVQVKTVDILSITKKIENKNSEVGLQIIDSLDEIFDIPTLPLPMYIKFIQERFEIPLFDIGFDSVNFVEEELVNAIEFVLFKKIGLQDTIALSTLVKLKLRNNKAFKNLLNQIASYQQSLNTEFFPKKEGVTILSSIVRPDSEHIGVIFNHAVPLVLAGCNVNLILMPEMEWYSWRNVNQEGITYKFKDSLDKYLFSSSLTSNDYSLIKSNLHIYVAPRKDLFNRLINTDVLRFEGVATFRTTNVFAKALINKCNVSTLLYSSAVKNVKFTNRVLVRYDNATFPEISFHPPIRIDVQSDQVFSNKPSNKISGLVTIYSANRIEAGLSNMQKEDWNALEYIFNKYKDLSWTLIGAQNIKLAYGSIPSYVSKEIRERIFIKGISELDSFYSPKNIIVALPNIPGAGGVGINALKTGMLVFTIIDKKSDLNNLVPDSFRFSCMEDIFNEIDIIKSGKKELDSSFHKIKSRLLSLGNLRDKGNELVKIVT